MNITVGAANLSNKHYLAGLTLGVQGKTRQRQDFFLLRTKRKHAVGLGERYLLEPVSWRHVMGRMKMRVWCFRA